MIKSKQQKIIMLLSVTGHSKKSFQAVDLFQTWSEHHVPYVRFALLITGWVIIFETPSVGIGYNPTKVLLKSSEHCKLTTFYHL